MHGFVEQVERLLMALLLFAVGAFVASGGLAALTWRGAAIGVLLHVLIRPAIGWLAQLRGPGLPTERAATAFFGIRGIGSFFYLAYALGEGGFGRYEREMWALVVFAVLISVVVHGAAATPVTAYLDPHDAKAGKGRGVGAPRQEAEEPLATCLVPVSSAGVGELRQPALCGGHLCELRGQGLERRRGQGFVGEAT
ncbi:cation:proton antiporter [Streptomyces cyaneofuscatus]|uniref:hypothetical protein n=1 Tax=Streptomyces cyaneofuscatus TaxID=66883 RepID=UPI0036D18181